MPCPRLDRLAALVVALIVAGCGSPALPTPSASPTTAAPSASSPPTSTPTPSPTATPTATAVSSASPAATLSPTPTPVAYRTPATDQTWIPLTGYSAIWSPDGDHFISVNSGGSVIFDAKGGNGLHVVMNDPGWLDNTHIVGIAKVNGWDQAQIVDIQTGDAQIVRPPHALSYALANGHGAVALGWDTGTGLTSPIDYAIWQDGVISDAQKGFPQLWSADGSMLALLHHFDSIRGPDGWLSVVALRDRHELYADGPPHATGDDVAFAPAGDFIAYATDSGEGPSNPDWKLFIRVVDLATATFVDLPRDSYGVFYWNDDGTISLLDQAAATLTTYSTAGEVIETLPAPFDGASRWSAASTVVFRGLDGGSDTLQVMRDGQSFPDPVRPVTLIASTWRRMDHA